MHPFQVTHLVHPYRANGHTYRYVTFYLCLAQHGEDGALTDAAHGMELVQFVQLLPVRG